MEWGKPSRPLELGGLDLHNLELLGFVFWIRWEWLRHKDSTKSWQGFWSHTNKAVAALFEASLSVKDGNGHSLCFGEMNG